jgi:hypothetical protein
MIESVEDIEGNRKVTEDILKETQESYRRHHLRFELSRPLIYKNVMQQ